MWDYNNIGNGGEKKDNSDKQEQMSCFLLCKFERLPTCWHNLQEVT